MKKYRRFCLIVKPTNACNMKCEYCFEAGENASCLDKKNRLSLQDFDKFIRIFSESAQELTVLYHGGEPTLVGKQFFLDSSAIIEKYSKLNSCKINCSMQTNNTLIDKDFLDVLTKCNIRIGTSYDGITNSSTRKNTEEYNRCFELEKEKGIVPGAICVVSKDNINSLIENYQYFNSREQNINLNPILITGAASVNEDKFAVSPEEYATKLKELFLYWLYDTNSKITVSPFTFYLNLIYMQRILVCCYGGCVGRWFNIEPNGDLYPCNRCFPSRYCFGNIKDINCVDDILNSDGMNHLLSDSVERIEKCKKTCEVFQYCKGGCNNSAMIYGKMTDNDNFWCKINRELINFVKQTCDNIDDLSKVNSYVKYILENSKNKN